MIRTGRLFLSALLALTLAVAARAGVVSVVPEAALAPIGLPALLLGGPSAAPAALTSALQAQTLAVTALPPAAVAPFLIERAVSAIPAERAAAKILAATLTTPAAREEPVRALAESAKADPALAGWFDGAKTPSLGLEGLTLQRGAWRRGETSVERLGQGDFGFVDVHPTVDGVVLKTVEHSASILMMSNQTPETTAAREKESADLLSSVDAGPRLLGSAVIDGRLVSARERVYGNDLDVLFYHREFGPAERELVVDLLRRMSAAGILTNDLRPANIMIGRTALDPRRRAYVVDGGSRLSYPAGLDEAGRLAALLDHAVVLHGRFDANVGYVEHTDTLARMMAAGVERSTRVTRWLRFKGFFKDLGRAFVP